MVTTAPGTTAPDASFTVPVIVPEADWACRLAADNERRNGKNRKTNRL
jgi:hypothetical protein